jgi:hypothetical protein
MRLKPRVKATSGSKLSMDVRRKKGIQNSCQCKDDKETEMFL